MNKLLYHFLVPFHALTVKVIGCRLVSLIGCILYLLGFCASAFATKLWHVLLSYSIVAG